MPFEPALIGLFPPLLAGEENSLKTIRIKETGEEVLTNLRDELPELYKRLSEVFNDKFGKDGYYKCTQSRSRGKICSEKVHTFDDYVRQITEIYFKHWISPEVDGLAQEFIFIALAAMGTLYLSHETDRDFSNFDKSILVTIPLMLKNLAKNANLGPEPAIQTTKGVLCSCVHDKKILERVYRLSMQIMIHDSHIRIGDESALSSWESAIKTISSYSISYYNSYGFNSFSCLDKIKKMSGDIR